MSNFDDSFRNSENTWKEVSLTSINPIKVLVVDYQKDSFSDVVGVLHFHSFEVTYVDHTDAALRLLEQKNIQYDLLMIDRDMLGMDIHKFLKVANTMDLLSVVMSEQEDDAFMLEVFKSGAFLVIKRPLTKDALGLIRQDIIRRRMHKLEKCRNENLITTKAIQDIEIRKKRVHISSDGDGNDDYNHNGETCMKKKIWVEWTEELHEKFLNALSQLDEGRWFPKKILELMDVPGLTRMQVASHLQKYRTDILKYNEMKMARDLALPIEGWQTHTHMSNQTYRASSMMNVSNRMNIAQGIEYSQIPFGCDLEFSQGDKFGKRITTNEYYQQTQSLDHWGQGSNDQDLLFIQSVQTSEELPNFVKYLDGKSPNVI